MKPVQELTAGLDDLTAARVKAIADTMAWPPLPLHDFIRDAWRYVEPDRPFIDNWHIGAMADHLTAVTWRIIQNLIINVPPRHMKSLTVGVFWPCWLWLWRPSSKWLFFGASREFAQRDNVKARTLMQTPYYRELVASRWDFKGDQNTKTRIENTAGGHRIGTGIKNVGGIGGDYLVGDDILPLDKANSEAERETANTNWSGAVRMRKNSPDAASVIIAQRLHEHDIVGYLAELEAMGGDKWERLILPAEYEPRRHCVTSIGFSDPRTKAGALLWPNRFPAEEIALQKISLGSAKAAAQLQQRPSPPEGDILKLKHIRFWHYDGQQLPPVRFELADGTYHETVSIPLPEVNTYAQSWDASLGSVTASASFVAGQVWGTVGAQHFLLDWVEQRLNFTGTLDALESMAKAWPQATTVLMEAKANGPAVIDSMSAKVPGLIGINPRGSKTARAEAVSPLFRAGQIFLPHPVNRPDIYAVVKQLTMFPHAATDDMVDALTQYLMEHIRKNLKRKETTSSTVPKSQLWGPR